MRAALVAAGRRLGARGLVAASEGNLSLRLPDGRLLVTPSGVRKDELEAADLVVVALDPAAGRDERPTVRATRPTSDLAIHRAIHLRRADVSAVVHAHPRASLALTLAGERPDPDDLPETALLLPVLPFVPFAPPGSAELARAIAEGLVAPPSPGPGAVLLERHGAVAVGTGPPEAALAQAIDRLELVEVLCRATRDALLLRAARTRGSPEA
jgi:L-fuculose-phosphate aldolase